MAGIDGDKDEVTASGDKTESSSQGAPGNDPIFRVPVPYTIYRYTPACSANDTPQGDDPKAAVTGADALCGQAVYTCPQDDAIRYRVSTMKMTADGKSDGEWEDRTNTVCRGADEPAEGGPVQITEKMIHDEAVKKAPTSVVHVEPETKSYVNVPTNFYAETKTETATLSIFDQPIEIRFAPSSYRWKFGDGGNNEGAGIEAAKVGQNGAIENVYQRIGDYSVNLTRSFAVTYTLPNGTSGALASPLSNTSAPYRLGIGEVQSVVTDVN